MGEMTTIAADNLGSHEILDFLGDSMLQGKALPMMEHRRSWLKSKYGDLSLARILPIVGLVFTGCQAPWMGAARSPDEQSAINLLQSPAPATSNRQSERTANDRYGVNATTQDSLSQPSATSRKPRAESPAERELDESSEQEFTLDDLEPDARRQLETQWKAATGRELDSQFNATSRKNLGVPAVSSRKTTHTTEVDSPMDGSASFSLSDQEDESQNAPATSVKQKAGRRDNGVDRSGYRGTPDDRFQLPVNADSNPSSRAEASSPQKRQSAKNSAHISDTVYREPVVKNASAERTSKDASREPDRDAELGPTAGSLAGDRDSSDVSHPLPTSDLDTPGLMRQAIQSISAELKENQSLDPDGRLQMEANQRLLHLMLGDVDAAMLAIESLQPHEQDFYRHLVQALHDVCDPSGNPDRRRRNTLALASLRKSLSHLAAASNLEVHNATFCSKVDGFGVIEKFPQYHFRHEQEVLLYCELDNFVAEKVTDGFETKLQGSYEIVNADGRRVADQTLPTDSHVCRNQRRDYFIAYRLYMPSEISPGKHTLKLTIEDLKGKKFGQTSLEFHIVK